MQIIKCKTQKGTNLQAILPIFFSVSLVVPTLVYIVVNANKFSSIQLNLLFVLAAFILQSCLKFLRRKRKAIT
jgi:hypothetical protein